MIYRTFLTLGMHTHMKGRAKTNMIFKSLIIKINGKY